MESSGLLPLGTADTFPLRLQAPFGMAQALLLNHFAGTWTVANFVQASLKLTFQEQLRKLAQLVFLQYPLMIQLWTTRVV